MKDWKKPKAHPRWLQPLQLAGLTALLLAAPTLFGCDTSPLPDDDWPAAQRADVFSAGVITKLMKSVAEHQRDTLEHEGARQNWIQAAFYTGVIAAYRATQDTLYLQQAARWAQANKWQLGHRLRLADDHASGQVYLELYQLDPAPERLEHTQHTFDRIMDDPRPGREDWHWCDALYMAPPTLARLSTVTGETSYRSFLHQMFWDAADYLYDEREQLFYRDERFFGSGTFWSRGNGWVLAGIVRVLQYLPPDDPMREQYLQRYRDMADALRRAQGPNGLWHSDLHRPNRFPNPETSGTGFFCYALAWGINEGHLPADTYEPVVRRAWKGLALSVHPGGRLGWVQPPGARPDRASSKDTCLILYRTYAVASNLASEAFTGGKGRLSLIAIVP